MYIVISIISIDIILISANISARKVPFFTIGCKSIVFLKHESTMHISRNENGYKTGEIYYETVEFESGTL